MKNNSTTSKYRTFFATFALAALIVPNLAFLEARSITTPNPVPLPVTVATLPAHISGTNVTLNGSYSITSGSAAVWFKYGTSANSLTQTTPVTVKSQGNGTFSATLTNLAPGTYFFRAAGSFGTTPVQATTTYNFTIASQISPVNNVTSLPATSTTTTTAILNGAYKINAPGTFTLVFKWGFAGSSLSNTLNYGTVTGTAQVTKTLTGLTPGTTYSYKTCLVNSAGTEQCGTTAYPFTTAPGTTPQVYQCNDGIDNDGDGYTDMSDAGCSSSTDDSENSNTPPSPCTSCCNNSCCTTDCDSGKPEVTTKSADDIDEDSALLIGEVDPNGSEIDEAWFEFGTDDDDLDDTIRVSSYDDNEDQDEFSFEKRVTGLRADTKYFYRACAENSDGEDCGSIKSFTTDDNNDRNDKFDPYIPSTPNPIIINRTVYSGSGSSSKVSLSIDARFDNAYSGDFIDYTLKYKNVSGQTLNDAVLHVEFPKGTSLRRATEGTYNKRDNTLTIDIGTLSVNENDTISISLDTTGVIRNYDELVTKATLAFTLKNGAQESAVDYAITKVSDYNGSVLGASAIFGGDGFLPNSILEWLILIALIFGIIVGARKYTVAKAGH